MSLPTKQLLISLDKAIEDADVFTELLSKFKFMLYRELLLASEPLLAGDLGLIVMMLSRLVAFENERIIVVALVLISAHLDDFSSLQDVQNIISTPHLRSTPTEVKVIIDFLNYVVASDPRVRLDILNGKIGQFGDFTLLVCLSCLIRLLIISIYHVTFETPPSTLRFSDIFSGCEKVSPKL